MMYRPSVNEVLARIFPDKQAHRWKVSFDDHGVSFCRGDHDRYEECDWEELPNSILNQVGDQLKAEHAAASRGIHMSHCNLGDYEGSCKYGEDDCPAMTAHVDPKIVLEQEAYDRVIAAAEDFLKMMEETSYYYPENCLGASTLVEALKNQFRDAATNLKFRRD